MKLHVIFGKKDTELFSTNHQITPSLKEELKNKSNQILTYTLNELPLTLKFIEYWQIYRKAVIKGFNGPYQEYNINYYPGMTQDLAIRAKKEMNETISKLKNHDIEVDNRLVLNESLLDREIEKLNELHLIFENELIKRQKIQEGDPSYRVLNSEVHYLLEKVNNLVHFLEGLTKEVRDKNPSNRFFMSVRPTRGILLRSKVQYYKLQDEDYRDFVRPIGGDLVCDFATVGKDLWNCSMSNDMNLIQKNEVKQQEYLTDFIFLNFKENYANEDKVRQRTNFKDHYNWCKKNQVYRYLDYTAPRYNPGRHILGSIDNKLCTGNYFYEHILSKTPAFLGYYLSDDSGNPLVPEGM